MAFGDQNVRRRAACEECRTKKLKCSGEQPACSRCQREGVECVYSLQKQMGRPKKRQRSDIDVEGELFDSHRRSLDESQSDVPVYSTLTDIPWLPSPISDWPVIPSEHSVPGLAPEASRDSPPPSHVPAEVAVNIQTENDGRTHIADASPLTLLNPTLTGVAGTDLSLSALPSCACLSTMYLTLSTLQTMQSPLVFPFTLHPLREAMQTTSEVLACQQCPTKFISAIQNTQLVGTLLVSIAERFSKVLDSITAEAVRAAAVGETKRFRVSDLNFSTSHLHTGGLGCAAAFQVDLSAAEWRAMTKKVVRAEVYGPNDGNNCCPYFLGLTQIMKERQTRWHQPEFVLPCDFPKDVNGIPLGGSRMPREDHVCLKMVAYAESLVRNFDWT